MAGDYHIIDRRKNPKGSSLPNRQRFVERIKKAVREKAMKALGSKKLQDQSDTVVSIPKDGIDEPRFHHDQEFGDYDYVLPGNHDFIVGDVIRKPRKKSGKGKGGAGNGGGGEDDFAFALSRDEYLNIVFDDLELPDLIKQSEKNAMSFANQRAGHTPVGVPSNLNVEKTVIAGISRRIALKTPKLARAAELEEELESHEVDSGEYAAISEEITSLRNRANAVSFLDNVDLRYNNFVKVPRPITQAVMFCVMDVSGSMGEREKIIAKKFFVLLHLFLERRYKNIDVVFIRHHDTAIECDEDTFFNSRESGGTVVSSAYEKVKEVMAARYPVEDWNIYMAQASDGDNWDTDNEKVTSHLNDLLPVIQHFNYIEITDENRNSLWGFRMSGGDSNLWTTINSVSAAHPNMGCAKIADEREVLQVFRNLFKSQGKLAA